MFCGPGSSVPIGWPTGIWGTGGRFPKQFYMCLRFSCCVPWRDWISNPKLIFTVISTMYIRQWLVLLIEKAVIYVNLPKYPSVEFTVECSVQYTLGTVFSS